MKTNRERLFGSQEVRIAQAFGSTKGTNYPIAGVDLHNGVDYGAPGGKPLACFVVDDGEVTENGKTAARGNFVTIFFFAQKRSGRYLHFDTPRDDLPVGKRVKDGDLIGYSGSTGDGVTGNHLHFGWFSGAPGAEKYEDYEAYAFTDTAVNAPLPADAELVAAVQTINLHADVTSWRLYHLGVAPKAGNEFATLNPAKFGGLTYEVKGYEDGGKTAIIQTEQFGVGKIFIDADATISGVAASAEALPVSNIGKSFTPKGLPLALYASAESAIALSPSKTPRTYTILAEQGARGQIANENFDITDHKVWVNLSDGVIK